MLCSPCQTVEQDSDRTFMINMASKAASGGLGLLSSASEDNQGGRHGDGNMHLRE
jgi:hypothetical protein